MLSVFEGSVGAFLEKYPQLQALLLFLSESTLVMIKSLLTVLHALALRLCQNPLVQSLISLPQIQNLINHPIIQIMIEHPILKDRFTSYPTLNAQTAKVMTNFLEEFDIQSKVDNTDTNNMILTFLSTPVKFTHLLNEIEAIENDSMNAENFVWICSSVAVIFVVTSASWLAIFLASYGSTYRKSIQGIAAFVTAILTLFFLLFSMKLRSMGEEADELTSFLLACSYLPFTFLITSVCCVSLYIVFFGTTSRKKVIDDVIGQRSRISEYERNVANLQKQIVEQESAHKRSLSELKVLKELLENSSEESHSLLHSSEEYSRPTAVLLEKRLDEFKNALSVADKATKESIKQCAKMTKEHEYVKVNNANSILLLESSSDKLKVQLDASKQNNLLSTASLNDLTKKHLSMEAENKKMTNLLKNFTSNESKNLKVIEKLKKDLESELELKKIVKSSEEKAVLEKIKIETELVAAIKRYELSECSRASIKKEMSPMQEELIFDGSNLDSGKVGSIKSNKFQINDIYEETNSKYYKKVESQQQQQSVQEVQNSVKSVSGYGHVVLYDEIKRIKEMKINIEIEKERLKEMKMLESSFLDVENELNNVKSQLIASEKGHEILLKNSNEMKLSLSKAEKNVKTAENKEIIVSKQLNSIEKEKKTMIAELDNMKHSALTMENKLKDMKATEDKLNNERESLKKTLINVEGKLLSLSQREAVLNEEMKISKINNIKSTQEIEALKDENKKNKLDLLNSQKSYLDSENICKKGKEKEKLMENEIVEVKKKMEVEMKNMKEKVIKLTENEKLMLLNIEKEKDHNKDFESNKLLSTSLLSKVEMLEKSLDESKHEILKRTEKERILQNKIDEINQNKSIMTVELNSSKLLMTESQEEIKKIKENEKKLIEELKITSDAKALISNELKTINENNLRKDEREKSLLLEKEESNKIVSISNNVIKSLKEETIDLNKKIIKLNDTNIKIENEKKNIMNKMELLNTQCKDLEKLKVKVEEDNKFIRNHLENKNLEITKLEEICASNLIISKNRITESEQEKDALVNSNSSLRNDLDILENKLLVNENKHAASMGELLLKLNKSNDDTKTSSLSSTGGNKSKDVEKDIDSLQNQLIERNTTIMTLQTKVDDIENSKIKILKDYNDIKEKLASHIIQSNLNEENSENELKEMEIQLKSFVEVCNSTRTVLLVAQDDLRTSEIKKSDDIKTLEKQIEELEKSNLLLLNQSDIDRGKMVTIEVEALNNINQMEIKNDYTDGLLQSSLQSNKRIQQQLDDNNNTLLLTRTDLSEQIKKKDLDFNTMKINLENELEVTNKKLLSALEAISIFEKEREDDIELMKEEFDNSVNARRKIIADFDNEREDLEHEREDIIAEERSRRNSFIFTPTSDTGTGSGTATWTGTGTRSVEEENPIMSAIANVSQIMLLKDKIDELELSNESSKFEYNMLNNRLENTLLDLENSVITKNNETKKLERCEAKNSKLLEECEDMRQLLLRSEIIEEQVRKQIKDAENDREQVKNALHDAEIALQNCLDEKGEREEEEEEEEEIHFRGVHMNNEEEMNENEEENKDERKNRSYQHNMINSTRDRTNSSELYTDLNETCGSQSPYSTYSTNSSTNFDIDELSKIHSKGTLLVQELKAADLDLRVLQSQIKANERKRGIEDLDFFSSPLHVISPDPTPVKSKKPSRRIKGEVARAEDSVIILKKLLDGMNETRMKLEEQVQVQVDENQLISDDIVSVSDTSLISNGTNLSAYNPYINTRRNSIPTTINPMRNASPVPRQSSTYSSTASPFWIQPPCSSSSSLIPNVACESTSPLSVHTPMIRSNRDLNINDSHDNEDDQMNNSNNNNRMARSDRGGPRRRDLNRERDIDIDRRRERGPWPDDVINMTNINRGGVEENVDGDNGEDDDEEEEEEEEEGEEEEEEQWRISTTIQLPRSTLPRNSFPLNTNRNSGPLGSSVRGTHSVQSLDSNRGQGQGQGQGQGPSQTSRHQPPKPNPPPNPTPIAMLKPLFNIPSYLSSLTIESKTRELSLNENRRNSLDSNLSKESTSRVPSGRFLTAQDFGDENLNDRYSTGSSRILNSECDDGNSLTLTTLTTRTTDRPSPQSTAESLSSTMSQEYHLTPLSSPDDREDSVLGTEGGMGVEIGIGIGMETETEKAIMKRIGTTVQSSFFTPQPSSTLSTIGGMFPSSTSPRITTTSTEIGTVESKNHGPLSVPSSLLTSESGHSPVSVPMRKGSNNKSNKSRFLYTGGASTLSGPTAALSSTPLSTSNKKKKNNK